VYLCFVFISTSYSLLSLCVLLFRFYINFRLIIKSLSVLLFRFYIDFRLIIVSAEKGAARLHLDLHSRPLPSLFFFVPSFALHHLIFSLFFLMSYPLCRYKRSTIDLIFLVKVSFLNKTQKNVLKKIN